MSIRCTTKVQKGMVALMTAAGLALGAVGCGGAEEDDKGRSATASASEGNGSAPSAQEERAEDPIAELRGSDGLILQVTSAERDAGGFVTVNAILKNDGAQNVTVPAALSGNETEIVRNGRSFGGATLVDSKSKKRYYVLRDTDGRPLTTTGFSVLRAGESLSVFMQFPAPPTDVSEVAFQVPTFASGTIQISG